LFDVGEDLGFKRVKFGVGTEIIGVTFNEGIDEFVSKIIPGFQVVVVNFRREEINRDN